MLVLTLSVSACFCQSNELSRRWRLEGGNAVIPYETWLRMVALRVSSDSLRKVAVKEAVVRARAMENCEGAILTLEQVMETYSDTMAMCMNDRRLLMDQLEYERDKARRNKGWVLVGKGVVVSVGVVGVLSLYQVLKPTG